MRITAFTHDWQPIGDLDVTRMLSATVIEEVNGENALVIETTQELAKGDRLLWRDGMGIWHEYAVFGVSSTRLGPTVVGHRYYCPWSLQLDLEETTTTAMPGTSGTPANATVALRGALQGTTRWAIGTVEPTTMGSASFWRKSGWEALRTLVETWGGEVRADITVMENWEVTRKVSLLAHVGSTTPTRRYDYGHDVSGITQEVLEEPWTCRVIPLGAGEELDSGGYGRKITIEDVNGGVVYLEDAESVPLVRKPDGKGGWEYPTQHVENPNMKTPEELKAWALVNLHEWTRPKVSYQLDVVQLAQAGNSQGVACGDEVVVVDGSFGSSGIQIDTRCVRTDTDLLDPSQSVVTLSNVPKSLGSQLASIARTGETALDMITDSGERQSSASYVSNLIERLNEQANLTGGYVYITEGQGIRTYDAVVSDPAVGTEASKVVEVKGGTIRIADSRTSSGDWDWRTVFVSGHVLADLVTAAKLTAGYIGSAESGNYWNLDTGQLRIAASSYLGDRTVEQVLANVSATITGVDVEYAQGTSPTQAPSSGWQTQPPAWEEGKYIWQRTATTTAEGTDYSTPVMISGKDGADGTSVTIRGSYDTLAELQAAHPTGSDGDAYMVGTDLYVWNGTAWEDVGQIQGPQGPAGTSVTVSSIQYGTSASASTAPTSWSTTPPTSIAAGRWLWVKTNYSNGSTATTKSYVGTNGTSVYVQSSTKVDGVTTIVLASSDGTTSTIRIADGEDGATGQRGPAGENGESSYIHTAWANSQDGTVDFSIKESEGKSYLGVCTDENTADPTTPSSYSWSRIEGAAGSDGVGVSGVTEQYYLSTSSGSPTGGTWQDSPPAFREGRFYFTRVITTYTDGHVVIQDPVLARGLNSANKNALDAAKTATDYLTFDNGLNVGYSGSQAKTVITTDGVEIFDGAGNSALFAGLSGSKSIVRVGRASGSGNVVMSSDGSVDVRSASTILAHFGYGEGKNASGGMSIAPYYNVGVRLSDTVVGNYSHAEGYNNTASGYTSHAEGLNTTASGNTSHAEGQLTEASGVGSHAEGYHTKATGGNSHAEGFYTEAIGGNSHASGYFTQAIGWLEFALGQYNIGSDSYYISVGCGTASSRANAMYLDHSGNIWIKGKLTQNSDRRLKEHHAYLGDDAAEFIRQLRPALYSKDGERHVGFYAQDVQEVEPDGWDTATVSAQHTDESLGFDPLTLDYTALIAPLVAYCQQLERRIEELEAR